MEKLDLQLMSLTMAINQVAREYKSAADRMASDFGLSQATAWPVIMIGRLGDGVRPGAVAEALGLVDQLIDAGLVERNEDANDRRARTLHLTAEGRKRAAKMEKALIPFRRALFQGVPREDVDACLRVLSGLSASIAAYKEADAG